MRCLTSTFYGFKYFALFLEILIILGICQRTRKFRRLIRSQASLVEFSKWDVTPAHKDARAGQYSKISYLTDLNTNQ